jgi:cobalt-zinc-cadmium efflux system protein
MESELHLDQSITNRFKYAIAITMLTLIAEVIGGIWTNSLALLSDAAHVFLDLFALILSMVPRHGHPHFRVAPGGDFCLVH